MNFPSQQSTGNINASEGQLLPIKIKQKDLLDDSQSSHTEACEDEIPFEILPQRGEIFNQNPQGKLGVKQHENLRQERGGLNFANTSTEDLTLMLHENMVEISKLSQLCVRMSEELKKRTY